MQMFVRFRRHLSVIALAVVASACGSDSSTGPEIGQPITLGQALATIRSPALAASAGTFGVAGTFAPAIVPSQCAYAAASQSFVCAPVTSAGLTFNQSFTLLDAAGTKQAAFDENTTTAVRANSALAGTLTTGGTTFTVDGQQALTLSGLLSGKHILDGTSTTHVAGTLVEGETQVPFTTTITTTITSLAVPVATSGTPEWPASGTIVVEASTAVGPVTPASTKVTITFSGSSTAMVSIVGPGFAQTCKVNLASSAPTCG